MDIDSNGVKKVVVSQTFYDSSENDIWNATDRLKEAEDALQRAKRDHESARMYLERLKKNFDKLVVEE